MRPPMQPWTTPAARRALVLALCLALLAAGCEEKQSAERREAPGRQDVDVPAQPGEVGWVRTGLLTPESAVYDPEQDVYFVSNVNGAPTARDDNGFIARIHPGTGTMEPRWIDGSTVAVTLNGPRGLTILGDELWAVDIDSVRRFDRRTGAERGAVAIPGSYFLNDAFAAPDGSVYVSDSGMPGATEGPPPGPIDAVYRVTPERTVEKVASGQDLHRPDGVWMEGGSLWVATFGSNEVYRLQNGRKADVLTLPKGALDGLMWLADGTLLVSSWDAGGVYHGPRGGPYDLVVSGIESPADFGFDTKRHVLIVPHFREDAVSLHGVGLPDPVVEQPG